MDRYNIVDEYMSVHFKSITPKLLHLAFAVTGFFPSIPTSSAIKILPLPNHPPSPCTSQTISLLKSHLLPPSYLMCRTLKLTQMTMSLTLRLRQQRFAFQKSTGQPTLM